MVKSPKTTGQEEISTKTMINTVLNTSLCGLHSRNIFGQDKAFYGRGSSSSRFSSALMPVAFVNKEIF